MGILSEFKQIDVNISKHIHELDHPVLTYVLYPFTAFFHPGLIWIPYLSVFYLSTFDLEVTFLYLIATLVCLINTTLLKKIFRRYTLAYLDQDQL